MYVYGLQILSQVPLNTPDSELNQNRKI